MHGKDSIYAPLYRDHRSVIWPETLICAELRELVISVTYAIPTDESERRTQSRRVFDVERSVDIRIRAPVRSPVLPRTKNLYVLAMSVHLK